MSQVRTAGRGRYRAVAALGVVAALIAGCSGGSGGGGGTGGAGGQGGTGQGGGSAKALPQVAVRPAANAANVQPTTPVVVSVTGGTLTGVSVADTAGHQVAGGLDAAATTWTSTGALGFGATYTVTAHAKSADGGTTDRTSRFSTLSPTRLGYDAMAPLGGTRMGVGTPIRIYFHDDGTDAPLGVSKAYREEVVKHIKVRTSPAQPVGYIWFGGGAELHLRPQEFWQAGTEVTVSLNLLGVQLTDTAYGKRSRDVSFTIGQRHYSVADTRTHRLLVYSGNKLIRNFPASMGKEVPGRFTHNGIHVVIDKAKVQHMDSTTYGLALDAGGYQVDVQYATRISNNGEFVHSAPWSVAQQGHSNVSHGCVNLAPANAVWFFNFSQPGDVVEVKGSKVPLTPKDGDIYDWTVPWPQWNPLG